jgi:hypothetical protein
MEEWREGIKKLKNQSRLVEWSKIASNSCCVLGNKHRTTKAWLLSTPVHPPTHNYTKNCIIAYAGQVLGISFGPDYDIISLSLVRSWSQNPLY